MTGPNVSCSELRDWVEAKISEVSRSLAGRTGSQAVCQIHKQGRVTGGLKYDEGQLVALNAVRRLLAGMAGPCSAEEIAAALEAERAKWESNLAGHQARERPALPWVAYYQGGLDAVTSALNVLTPAPELPPQAIPSLTG